MRPVTVYRHCLESGLDIELDGQRTGLLVYGPKPMRQKRMALIQKNGAALVRLLLTADAIAADAIDKAKRPRIRHQRPNERPAPAKRGAHG